MIARALHCRCEVLLMRCAALIQFGRVISIKLIKDRAAVFCRVLHVLPRRSIVQSIPFAMCCTYLQSKQIRLFCFSQQTIIHWILCYLRVPSPNNLYCLPSSFRFKVLVEDRTAPEHIAGPSSVPARRHLQAAPASLRQDSSRSKNKFQVIQISDQRFGMKYESKMKRIGRTPRTYTFTVGACLDEQASNLSMSGLHREMQGRISFTNR